MLIKKIKNQYLEVRLLPRSRINSLQGKNAKVGLPLKNQNGSAIFLVVLVLAGILIATIGINNLVVNGIKFSRNIAWSAPAYFAAETGMEKALYETRVDNSEGKIPEEINGYFDLRTQKQIDEGIPEQKAEWTVGFKCSDAPTESCAGELISDMPDDTMLTIKSTGSFNKVNRSIESSFCIVGDCP